MDLSRRSVCSGLVGLAVLAAVAARAEAAKRSVAVEVTGAPGWRSAALSQALGADLADDRLAPRSLPSCGGPCSDAALRGAGVDLLVRGVLTGTGFGYELRALWPGAPAPVRGALPLGRLDRVGFSGALRDQLHRLARATSDDTAAPEAATGSELPGPGGMARALAIALAVLALPIGYGALRTRRLLAREAALRTSIGTLCAGGAAIAVAAVEPANGHGVLLAAGGLAWGALIAVTVPVVLPPLVGLGRIDYRELGRLLAGWAGLAVQRAVAVAVIYAPVALGVALAGDAVLDTGDAVRFALVLPIALLVERQCLRLGVAVAAERLDAALTDVALAPAVRAAWQDAVRGYLAGYLRRNGLPIDDDLLDHLVILPATGEEVVVYGGGATHTRLAIPRRMLELALAPWGRPHDYAAPRVSTLHWTEWNAGLVMATEAGAVIATREQRQPRQTTDEGDPSEHAREPLGEPPTLAGIIEPRALDPRTSYRPHDDPAWLDWESGEDYDGTDAGDRDFLFGVLAHAVAEIQRHGDRFATLARALIRAGGFTAPITRRLGRLLERLPDAVGDDHTAIAGARHHLVQYLGWEAWQRDDLLTARAYAPELEAMSRRILAVSAPVTRGAPAAARARKRLARLAGLVAGTPAASSLWRRLALAGAVLAGLGAGVLAVADAVRYHAGHAARTTETTERPDHGKD